MRAGEAIVIAAATLVLIVVRPRNLNEGIASLFGAALILILGLVSLSSAIRLEAGYWNIFLFFLGMMTVAAVADQSGVFDAIAFSVAGLARGRVAGLYAAILVLGAIISLLFANDSTALVLTPIVYALVVRLRLDPLPFVFATTFIADTASVALPVSNPLNVILSDAFHLGLGSYVAHLWLPALLVIIVNAGVFFVLYRHRLRGTFQHLPRPKPATGLRSTSLLLAALAIGYLVASALRFPVGIVAVCGGAALSLNLTRLRTLDLGELGREISWPIFGFIAGMFVIIQALHDQGVTDQIGLLLARAGSGSAIGAIAATTVGTALGSNLINNLPMSLVMVKTLPAIHVSGAIRMDMVYSSILGCDLGPNLTHLGSLATFLWLFFLRRKGLDVSAWDYFKIGVVVTPLLLGSAILGLWATSSI
ncbi:MAG: ArsB/NhaD family transporter [Chloroflexota bacterium]